MSERPLNFSSIEERHKWIVDHAEHYTVVRFKGRGQYDRHKAANLADAETLAARMVKAEGGHWMIYAVEGGSDTFIKTVK